MFPHLQGFNLRQWIDENRGAWGQRRVIRRIRISLPSSRAGRTAVRIFTSIPVMRFSTSSKANSTFTIYAMASMSWRS
jgi:hypothetical protein